MIMETFDLMPDVMGFDVKALGLRMFFTDDIVEAVYFDINGEKAHIFGTNEEVKETLLKAGYKLYLGKLPFNCKDDDDDEN